MAIGKRECQANCLVGLGRAGRQNLVNGGTRLVRRLRTGQRRSVGRSDLVLPLDDALAEQVHPGHGLQREQ